MDKKKSRIRRSKFSRFRIRKSGLPRLSVHRTNLHIYASIFDSSEGKTIVTASTLEKEVRSDLTSKSVFGGNKEAATVIGKRLAEKAKKLGISKVAFDRSGFRYHGRVKALADAARESGLVF
jgi:large subunit ribosomal protein L18